MAEQSVFAPGTERGDLVPGVSTIEGSITDALTLSDTLLVRNLTTEPVEFSLEFRFEAAFEDIFAIRGLFEGKRGACHKPEWRGDTLYFRYAGADKLDRVLAIQFEPSPNEKLAKGAGYRIQLDARGLHETKVTLKVSTSERPDCAFPSPAEHASQKAGGLRRWFENTAEVHSSSRILSRVMDRSLRDLGLLRSTLDGGAGYFAAGVPWFVALFGRDSIITALQTLAYDYSIAEQTIRLLARYQGTKLNGY